MKKILVIDACVRREASRTKKLLDHALEVLGAAHTDWEFQILNLMDMDLKYWNTESLKRRDALLAAGRRDDPLFDLGNQFRMADGIVVAAPFWDLSVPAVLKVYIENISADGITFGSGPEGLYGLCRGEWMLFLTTRGGIWEGSDMEQGSPYMESLCKFFGIDRYACVSADGIDIVGLDHEKIMSKAMEDVETACRELTRQPAR